MGNLFFDFRNVSDDTLQIEVVGYIGSLINNGETFYNIVRDTQASTIELYIDSEGGSVFEAFQMREALVRSGKQIKAYIGTLCASAATILSSTASEVIATPSTFFMIHRVRVQETSGTGIDLIKIGEQARDLDDTIIDIYKSKTNLSKDDLTSFMDSGDFWMNAKEAKRKGFVNRISSKRPKFQNCVDIEACDIPESIKSEIRVNMSETGNTSVLQSIKDYMNGATVKLDDFNEIKKQHENALKTAKDADVELAKQREAMQALQSSLDARDSELEKFKNQIELNKELKEKYEALKADYKTLLEANAEFAAEADGKTVQVATEHDDAGEEVPKIEKTVWQLDRERKERARAKYSNKK